jgi:uncharacterized membrane protein
MQRILFVAGGIFVILHALIHLFGFVAYWPLAEMEEFPYKTALLSGRLAVGAGGMRVFSAVWLVVAVVMAASAVGYLFGLAWWQPVMVGVSALSIVICLLDFEMARWGALISALILAAIYLAPRIPFLAPAG